MSDSADEIAREIRRQVEAQGEKELRAKGREFATEVLEYAKSISPENLDDGNAVHYKDSFKLRARNIIGRLPSWRIINTDPLARVLEDGSGPDRVPQGGGNPSPRTASRST